MTPHSVRTTCLLQDILCHLLELMKKCRTPSQAQRLQAKALFERRVQRPGVNGRSNPPQKILQNPPQFTTSHWAIPQSFQKPTEYRTMIAQLEDRPANWQDLPSRTLNSFNVILQIDGNEGSIQKGIVPILMNYAGLMLNAETLVIIDIPFSKSVSSPSTLHSTKV
ncbi:hypothetical protein N7516_002068 [Penicillium verrucosum]|uniref:uncharacterized protein n=1 Tax=Penicillium verrucosum TaxID=60171 RepID=UPI0025458AEE|nr:uncharacterized protein N7516_002068 [Penicillium verrucosum]KAJ5941900.1 hypothetical protein N7516_002068 [Penicillium verrucosum]